MKDPAFLFYSKDWIQGTAEMMPEEKGVYIDLLAQQHQKGSLPNDHRRLARMVGLGIDEFESLWEVVSEKFECSNGRLFNKKLRSLMTDRKDKGHTNKIIGIFGGLCKKADFSFDELQPVRKAFKVSDFKQYESDEVSERLTEWFDKRIALLGSVDVNEDESIDEYNKGVPSFEEFLEYALKNKPNVDQEAVKLKYEAWKVNGWKTGGKTPRKIKNWKTTLLNTLKHLGEQNPKTYESAEDREAREFMENLKKESIKQILDVQPNSNYNEPSNVGRVQRISERSTRNDID